MFHTYWVIFSDILNIFKKDQQLIDHLLNHKTVCKIASLAAPGLCQM